MKTIITSAFLLISAFTFAQDAKKETASISMTAEQMGKVKSLSDLHVTFPKGETLTSVEVVGKVNKETKVMDCTGTDLCAEALEIIHHVDADTKLYIDCKTKDAAGLIHAHTQAVKVTK